MNRRSLEAESWLMAISSSLLDATTGVFAESYTLFLLDSEIHRARRYGTPFALALIAMDEPQAINDGGAQIDPGALWAEVVRLLGKNMREVDVAGHFGPDELILLLPNVTLGKAMIGLERLRMRVENRLFQSDQAAATISGGVSEYAGENSGPLIAHCRSLLHHAQERGGNRFCIDSGFA